MYQINLIVNYLYGKHRVPLHIFLRYNPPYDNNYNLSGGGGR